MSLNILSTRMPRGASVLTVAGVLLLVGCGRDTVAPAAPEAAVSATAGVQASANDNRPALLMVTAPAGAAAGVAFTIQPVLELRNNGGNLVMANKSVTVALEGASVVLGGTKSAALVKGVARFTNLSIPAAGTYTLLFTGDSFTPVRATIVVAPTMVTLAVTMDGAGHGAVTSNPAGIDCGATCSFAFNANASVTLTAQPTDIGSTFTGWTGAGCAGTGQCTVTMDAAKSVTATFGIVTTGPPVLTLAFGGSGGGIIVSDQSSTGGDVGDTLCSSPASCALTQTPNDGVMLIAVPNPGSSFAGWTGGTCENGNDTVECLVIMSASTTMVANFSAPQLLARNNLTGGALKPRTMLGGGLQ